ncbi:hypothetical protein [Massilia sp. BSC265]|uniref:hypothetical protein n=1 Tax=Massilia sp. BSC265 TaxID=1549812 RepID=UPI0004E95AF4|nr:hypothetical protein [Massilia sp. BSC265]KFI07280.1 hypothetical protein JN27_10025 [Massilia sp. BSC265]
MKGLPGSIGWLLRHEIRLAWYNAAAGKATGTPRRPGMAGLAIAAAVWLVLHGIAWFVLARSTAIDTDDPRVLVAVTALLFGSMTFMLSSALKSSVVVLFERGDLDLLLSSPLPSRSIFTVRLGVVAAGTSVLYLFLLTPFAHAGALLGYGRWLAVYPVILGCATIVACMAMLVTLGLVRVLGARRTRVIAQLIGALAGALLFILAQLLNVMSQSREAEAAAVFERAFASQGLLGAASLLWLPGRALLGEALPVVGLVALAVAAFMLTTGLTHGFFVYGLQQAASSASAGRRPSGGVHYRFGHGLFDTVVRKEWRLIVRDPQLISQVALQLLYLLPLCLVMFRRSDVHVPALIAGLTLLCSSLTASLAWIVVSAEEAPDLLVLAPAPQPVVRLAKLAAGVMPALLIASIPLAWLVLTVPIPGLLACFTVSGATCTAALIVHWCGKAGSRSDYKARGRSDTLTSILGMLNSLSWGGLGWCLATVAGGAASGAYMAGGAFAGFFASATLVTAWLLRRRAAS